MDVFHLKKGFHTSPLARRDTVCTVTECFGFSYPFHSLPCQYLETRHTTMFIMLSVRPLSRVFLVEFLLNFILDEFWHCQPNTV
jgi:hypothetical protein